MYQSYEAHKMVSLNQFSHPFLVLYWQYRLPPSLQEHDRHVQFLMKQISQGARQQESAESADHDMVAKVRSLERDLYYYRKTSRDLRKKLQALTSSEVAGVDNSVSIVVEGVKMAGEERVSSAPELEESGRSHRRSRRKQRDLGSVSGRSKRGLESESRKMREGIEAAVSVATQKGVAADNMTATSLQVDMGKEARAVLNQQLVGGDLPDQHQVGGVMPMVAVKRHKNELRQLR